MNKSKIFALLGFAAKAGKLSYGFNCSVETLSKGKSKLVLSAEDVSQKSTKEISFFAEKYHTQHIILEGIDIKAVSDAVGRKCGIISVNDEGFAKGCVDAIIGGNANDK